MTERLGLKAVLRIIGTPVRFLFIGLVYLYKFILSPILPNSCIYTPSCSQYTIEALKKHGAVLGFILSVSRIGRCTGGLFTGGEDPVPERFSFRHISKGYKKFRRRKDH